MKNKIIIWTIVALVVSFMTSMCVATLIYLFNAIILGNQDRGSETVISLIKFCIYYLPFIIFIVVEYFFVKKIMTS